MRSYVQFFFGCRDCADHFEQMAAASMHQVRSPSNAILWLLTSHNRVNARLSGKEGLLPRLEVAMGAILAVIFSGTLCFLHISASPVSLAPCAEEADGDTE